VAASSGAPETKQQKRLAAAAIKATVKDLVADVIAQDKKETKEKKEKARLLKAAAAALAKTIKKPTKTIKKKLSVHARMIALGCDGIGYLRVACARELGSGDHGSKEDMVERLELARSTAA
jgi:hypothetical protein